MVRMSCREESDTPARESDRAYRDVKDLLLKRLLQPGQAINEAVLMRNLNVGRTPLREAFWRLNSEGLVTIIPRRGIFVTELCVTDIQHIFELRIVLEEFAARLAAERITDAEVGDLEALLMDRVLSDGTDEGAREADWNFHDVLNASTGNPYLRMNLEQLRNLSLNLLYVSKGSLQVRGQMRSDLMAIFDAVRRHDPDAAAQAMRAHIQGYREQIRGGL